MTPSKSWNLHSAWRIRCFMVALALLLSTGCSVKKFAIRRMADSLASQSTSSFATDDDPERRA